METDSLTFVSRVIPSITGIRISVITRSGAELFYQSQMPDRLSVQYLPPENPDPLSGFSGQGYVSRSSSSSATTDSVRHDYFDSSSAYSLMQSVVICDLPSWKNTVQWTRFRARPRCFHISKMMSAVTENLPSEINIYSSQTVDLEFRKTRILSRLWHRCLCSDPLTMASSEKPGPESVTVDLPASPSATTLLIGDRSMAVYSSNHS